MKRLLLFAISAIVPAVLLWPQNPPPGGATPNNPPSSQCSNCKQQNKNGKQTRKDNCCGHNQDHHQDHHHGHHHGHHE